MWGADWTEVEIEPTGVCFNLTIAGWMHLFAEIGFAVTRYQEVYAPDWALGTRAAVPADWAKSYPVEQVWHLEKTQSRKFANSGEFSASGGGARFLQKKSDRKLFQFPKKASRDLEQFAKRKRFGDCNPTLVPKPCFPFIAQPCNFVARPPQAHPTEIYRLSRIPKPGLFSTSRSHKIGP